MCDYNGGGSAACDGGGLGVVGGSVVASAPLLVGATLTMAASGSPFPAGVDNAVIDVDVTYQ